MRIYISQLIASDEYLEIIKKYGTGLELIDFSIANVLDNPKKYIGRFKESEYRDIDFGIHGPFFDLIPATYDKLVKEVTLLRFNQAYQIAKELNAKHIIFHSGFLKDVYYYESWLQNSIIFWQEFLKDKDDSLPIYIENVFENEFLPLKELVRKINRPNFNICLDIGHANIRSKYDLKEWIVELKDYIKHFHIHNNDGNKDLHNEVKNGTIDYQEIFNLIKELKIVADVTLEMTSYNDIKDSIEFIKQAV